MEIDVLGQGRARHGGGLGRCQTREFESKTLQERFRRASFGGKVQNQPKKSSNMKKRQDHADFREEEAWREWWCYAGTATWTPRSPCENVNICR